MNREVTLLAGGIGLGAALMYMLDPDRGRRRRALLRDQLVRVAHGTPDAVGAAARDLSNRARGLAAGAGSMLSSEEVSNEVLVARVRSKMGRVVSHPHAIEVTADQGRVTLGGPVLAREVAHLLSCVSRVRGVAGVESRLEVHAEAGNVPALQGGRRRPVHRFEFFQENWSPTARLLAGLTGGALAAYGLSRRDLLSLALGAVGVGLLARGVTNIDMRSLAGAGAALFDSDPKREADEDRGLVETSTASGNVPHEPAGNQPRAFGASA